MLIAISGSQGSGKSVCISTLHQQGFKCVERKTSRSILSDWGVSLQEVNTQPDLTRRFQDEIIERKFADELEAINSSEVWFTERTYADLFTYTVVALGGLNEHSAWLDSYYERCKDLCKHYAQVHYLTAGHFTVEHDGIRGSNKHYSRLIDVAMYDFTSQMCPNTMNVITSPDLDCRINTIMRSIK